MKQIQGSVRVKINEYVHAWSEFLFVSLLVIFNFIAQINHFYHLTSLHGLQDVENHCAHLRDNGFLVSKETGNASVGEMKTKTWFYQGLTLETSAF